MREVPTSEGMVREDGRRWSGRGEVHILEMDILSAFLWTGMVVKGGGFTVSTSSGVTEVGREWTG